MTHAMDPVHSTDVAPGVLQEHTVICGGTELDIAGAQELYDSLLAALQTRQPVVFDMGHVERVDTAILQMLCAFVRDAQAMEVPVHWQHASQTIQNAARLLNVDACLALPAPSPQDGCGTTANLAQQ